MTKPDANGNRSLDIDIGIVKKRQGELAINDMHAEQLRGILPLGVIINAKIFR